MSTPKYADKHPIKEVRVTSIKEGYTCIDFGKNESKRRRKAALATPPKSWNSSQILTKKQQRKLKVETNNRLEKEAARLKFLGKK